MPYAVADSSSSCSSSDSDLRVSDSSVSNSKHDRLETQKHRIEELLQQQKKNQFVYEQAQSLTYLRNIALQLRIGFVPQTPRNT